VDVDVFLPAAPKGFIAEGIAEYRKRLSGFCELRLFYGDGPSRSPARVGGSRVNMLVGGPDAADFTSEGFAAWLRAQMNRSASRFSFWAPRSGENPRIAWDGAIRLTYIETDWDLTALILAEQIYRAFMILNGSPYHK